jgi:hypothetical protein
MLKIADNKKLGRLFKVYRSEKFSLVKLLLSEVFLISIPTVVIVGSLYKGGDPKFLYVGFIFASIVAFLIFERYKKGRISVLTVYENGVETEKGLCYLWQDIQRVEPRKHEEGIYSGFLPGFWLHFNDGKKQFIPQDVTDYQSIYKLFYDRKISGASAQLPMYELSDTGTARGKWASPKVFYDPKADKTVI